MTPTTTATPTATVTATTIPYRYLPVGAFVLGDQSVALALAAPTPRVTWWGAQWAKENALSGGPAPSAFKGFASSLSATPPTCGSTWTTGPGNSPAPPSQVPAYMAVVVASTITRTGATVSGNAVQIVVVKTSPGYGPDPGHAGTGTIVQVLCDRGAPTHLVLGVRAQAPAPARLHPTLHLDRARAAVGDRLCATGAGFLRVEPVTVAVDGVAVAQTTTGTAGRVTVCFAVPGNAVAGPNDVSATGARSRTPAASHFTGLFPHARASTAYFAGASTASGTETELDLLNPQTHAAHVTLRLYRRSSPPLTRAVAVPAQARATLFLSRYLPHVPGFGLRVQADQVIAAQLIVRRRHRNPYTTLGSGLLSARWYLAEGYTGLTFHETISILNPDAGMATVQVRLLPVNGHNARVVRVRVPGQRVTSLDVNRLYPHSALAAIVSSDHPTSVARVLTFGAGASGATGNTGTPLAATTWLFAEGSAAQGRQTFLTILNPGRTAATVTARFSDPRGRALGRRTIVVAGLHRGTILLNDSTGSGAVATTLTSTAPVVVERPFYLRPPNAGRVGATLVYGRSGTGRSWTFPAGETTQGAREDLLLLNPNPVALAVHVRFYLARGRVVARTATVPAQARYTLHVNAVAGVANTRHGAQLVATNGLGFVAEQSIVNSDGTAAYGTVGLAQ